MRYPGSLSCISCDECDDVRICHSEIFAPKPSALRHQHPALALGVGVLGPSLPKRGVSARTEDNAHAPGCSLL